MYIAVIGLLYRTYAIKRFLHQLWVGIWDEGKSERSTIHVCPINAVC